jgi:hypothetical protein
MAAKRPLPESAQVIADIIGREATLALAGKVQHRALYIPKHPVPDRHMIPSLIGRQRAELLRVHFGGLLLPLAKCAEVHAAERDDSIRAGAKSGKTTRQLAELWGLTIRRVEQIIQPIQRKKV